MAKLDGQDKLTEEQLQERHKIILEIMALAYAYQANHPEHIAFIDWSGHVDLMDIKIAKSKSQYNEVVAGAEFYTDVNKFNELQISGERDPNVWLRNKRDTLRDALEKGGIEYTDLTIISRTVYENHF